MITLKQRDITMDAERYALLFDAGKHRAAVSDVDKDAAWSAYCTTHGYTFGLKTPVMDAFMAGWANFHKGNPT